MKAIWSFWSKPFQAQRRWTWPSPGHHLFAWVLSVETARQHYPDTWLITDDAGARLLVDQLGLPFTHVSTDLNALAHHNPDWWALGKIYAYWMQTEPFVHIDSDVLLWKPLPDRLTHADVFAQHPEPISATTAYRPVGYLASALNPGAGCWLPDEWTWYQRRPHRRGECCGIFGGNRIDFIQRFAAASLRLIQDPANYHIVESLHDKPALMLVIEQYLLAAFVEFYRSPDRLPSGPVHIEYLFDSLADSWNPTLAARAGFTHLPASTKQNPQFSERLARRVQRDYPTYYWRCVNTVDL